MTEFALPVFLDEDLGRVRIDSISHEGCEFLDVRACGEEVHAIICDDTSKSMQPKPVGLRLWNIPAAGVLSRVSGVWADIPSAMSRKPHALSPIQAGPSVFGASGLHRRSVMLRRQRNSSDECCLDARRLFMIIFPLHFSVFLL